MNNTFLLWLGIAGAIGVGLLLLLGTPVAVESQDVVESVSVERGTTEIGDESAYWEPAAPTAATTPARVVYVAPTAQCARQAGSCSSCGRPLTSPSCPACGMVVAPVVRPASSCSRCGGPATAASCASCDMSRATPTAPLVAGCGNAVAPCSSASCSACSPCGDSCGDPCVGVRPGINRNMDLCVDECGFVQLHSTVPRPLCRNVHFRWYASRGSFLDPTVGAPMYYAPTTHLLGGEDVWITLTVIAPDGTEYSDHINLHVNNVR